MYKATVRVPGSCGELAQGIIDEVDFMITCPINLYSQVSVVLSKKIKGVKVVRSDKKVKQADKTIKALQLILDFLNKREFGARIEIKSELIPGKGMASSTADITGTIAAMLIAFGCRLNFDLIRKLALEIEPTDGTFLPGIYFFDHKSGRVVRKLGQPLLLDILIFTAEGEVDTVKFNQRKDLREKNRYKVRPVREAVNLIERGIRLKNKELLGWGASLSAFAHQWIMYKPYLVKLKELGEGERGFYGINIAHSGTLIGLLVEPGFSYYRLVRKINEIIPEITFFKRVELISGGIEILNKVSSGSLNGS